MPTRHEILSWLRRHGTLRIRFQEHFDRARIEIGFGFALLVSLIFVVVQSGNV